MLDSVESICREVIDGFCEHGEVDLVEVLSQPFPLLVICDMMGIPRSEFQTVLDATNIILGAGDPEVLGGRDPFSAMFESGLALTNLMNDVMAERRANPTNDLTSALVHNDLGEDMLAEHEIPPFFILLAVAGNDTTRTAISHGMHLLSTNPDQRAIWQSDLEGVTPTAVEEIVRVAAPVTFMRRTATRDVSLSGHDFVEGDKLVLFYGAANRDPREFPDPERFDVRRTPNNHVGFGGPGPHFCLGAHLARREVSVVFRQLLTRLPDIEVVGEPIPLDAMGIPLVGGIKHLKVKFTPVPRSRRVVARPGGFEPPTYGLEVRCSIQLSYGRLERTMLGGVQPAVRGVFVHRELPGRAGRGPRGSRGGSRERRTPGGSRGGWRRPCRGARTRRCASPVSSSYEPWKPKPSGLSKRW